MQKHDSSFWLAAGLLAAGLAVINSTAAAAVTCADPGTPSDNKVLVKKFYVALDTKNKDLLDEVLAEDWVDVPLAPGQQPGRTGMKGAMDGYFKSFPDFNVLNQDVIAEGDKVVVRSTIRATQRGAFAGVAASNKPFTIMAIDIHQVCNGRVVQTWHLEDWLSGLFQMGALPPAGGGN